MRVSIILGLLLAALTGPARAQSDEVAVVEVLTRLFDGMRERDTALMRSVFAPHGRLLALDTRGESPQLRSIDPSQWIGSVGRGSGPGPDERIFDPVVHVDGDIAQAWVYYELWVGTRLSHCGYDAFFLVRLGDGWRVGQVADTRRTDCTPRS